MNNFIQKILKRLRKHESPKFYESLTQSLYTKDPPLYDLFDDLEDNYCEGGKLLGNQIYLGCVYMFEYDQKENSSYNKVQFKDKTPMVLVTAQDKTFIRGINLNLCPSDFKTLILNMMSNLDEKFFDGGYVKMCNENKKPLSDNVLKFMALEDSEDQIINAFKKTYPDPDYSAVFRTYRKERIKKIRFIEWYIMPYIPSIEYKGMPPAVLKLFWKLSNLSKIKL